MDEIKAFEFSTLEQRKGTHELPVPLTVEQVAETARRLAELLDAIEDAEQAFKSVARLHRDRLKEMRDELIEVRGVWKDKQRNQTVAGVWGYDFKDTGAHETHALDIHNGDNTTVDCETCNESFQASGFYGVGEMVPCPDEPKPLPRPYGRKWFMNTGGYVFGPYDCTENDTQMTLPDVAEVAQFRPKKVAAPESDPEPTAPDDLEEKLGESVVHCPSCKAPTMLKDMQTHGSSMLCAFCVAKIAQ